MQLNAISCFQLFSTSERHWTSVSMWKLLMLPFASTDPTYAVRHRFVWDLQFSSPIPGCHDWRGPFFWCLLYWGQNHACFSILVTLSLRYTVSMRINSQIRTVDIPLFGPKIISEFDVTHCKLCYGIAHTPSFILIWFKMLWAFMHVDVYSKSQWLIKLTIFIQVFSIRETCTQASVFAFFQPRKKATKVISP